MSKISHRSTEPFQFFTFMLLQNIIFRSNNHYWDLHCVNSSCIFMTLPFLIDQSFDMWSNFRIGCLKFLVELSLSLSYNVQPKLQMIESRAWFWEINSNNKDSLFKSFLSKWNLNQIHQISSSSEFIKITTLLLLIWLLLRVWELERNCWFWSIFELSTIELHD